jgi:WhiB family redox-sensing transcriptional regulator
MPQQPIAQVPADETWFWQDYAECRSADQQLFFHPQHERGTRRRQRDRAAKIICARCPVRIECADYAVRAHEPYGVWGGLTEEERASIYARLDLTNYPRIRGTGIALAADAIQEAVSPRALA